MGAPRQNYFWVGQIPPCTSSPLPFLSLEVGPLNTARESGGDRGVSDKAPTESEFGAF